MATSTYRVFNATILMEILFVKTCVIQKLDKLTGRVFRCGPEREPTDPHDSGREELRGDQWFALLVLLEMRAVAGTGCGTGTAVGNRGKSPRGCRGARDRSLKCGGWS